MKNFKRFTALLLSVGIVVSLFGCTDKDIITNENEQQITSETLVTDVSQVDKSSFAWQPHIFNDKLTEYYGDEIKQDFYNFIDAVIAGKHFCECSSEANMNVILYQFQYMFPVMFAVVSAEECSFEDGHLYIVYLVDNEERQEIINDFKNSIDNLVKSSVSDEDTLAMKAAALYANYTEKIQYNSNYENDVDSPYGALTEYKGICQSFAYAYCYLCMQCGIESTVVVSNEPSHMWVLLEVDGKMYYADPTYGSSTGSMEHFGIDINERLSSPDFSGIEVMYAMQSFPHSDSDVSDDRFSEVHKIVNFESIERKDGRMFINGKDADGNSIISEVI